MSRQVLIIDDEPHISRALKTFFERKGFGASTAASAKEALEVLRDTPVDVVLLDLKLPDATGLELLSQIKHQVPSRRVIVISGMADRETIDEAIERGASDYLTKPFDLDSCFYAAMEVESVDLTSLAPQGEAVAKLPASVAQQYQVVPIRVADGALELGMRNPLDVQLVDELQTLLGCRVRPLAVTHGDIGETLRKWYGVGAGVTAAVPESPAARPSAAPREAAASDAAGVSQLINDLIAHAYANRASDLHVGIGAEGPWIQERIDGILYTVPVSKQLVPLYNSIVSRLKVMANLNIAEHRLPQDGRIWFEKDDVRLDLRLSVLPTLHGESLVIRLLEPSQIYQLDQLGLDEEQLAQMQTLLAKPTGLILVTGPTGSGKSTSLYAFLSKLNTGRSSIVTIEDPIEHELPQLRQIQIHQKIGLNFATGLRSILRHDPDIVMVGEIRDQETATLAVGAALTGHLVLSTLHTNDAASGITRLLDLGIEPFLLSSTLSGILSQRLVRLLCEKCRSKVDVDAASLAAMGVTVPQQGPVPMWRTKGCKACRETGYHGRTAVFELLPVDHHIRGLIIKRTPNAQIKQSAISQGMSTLWQSGWRKMQAGLTSLEELIRVIPRESR